MATEMKMIKYEKCCRTCLKEDNVLMFDLFMETLESRNNNLTDILVSCAKLQIRKDDSLPKQICGYCYNSLISFSHFCNMAQKAEETLKEIMLRGNELNQKYNKYDHINCNGVEKYGSDELIIEIKRENNDDVFNSHGDNFETKCHENLDDNKNFNEQLKISANLPKIEHKFHELNTEEPQLNFVHCKKQFNILSKLKQHQQKHLTNKKSKCKLHASKYNENDITLKNEENSDINWICAVCSSRFESIHLLSAHMKIHEEKYNESINTIVPKENVNNNILNDGICEIKNQFQCEKCLLTFKSINSLSAHMRKHTEKGRVISCKECNKVFKKLSHLKRHEISHEINCPFKCNMCTKSFPTEDVLEEHINKHRGIKPHMCPLCGKEFIHLSTLRTHVKIHTREKSFLCPTCGKKFDTSTNLNQHQLRHTGLKKFACNLCPQKFVSKGELKSHTITHTGERSYTCDQCGATFTKRCSLTKHSTRHSGLKPYQCTTCLVRFTCKDHLKRHYRIHTGEKPYKCEMCERAFTQSNDLVKHRRSHLGDKVYKCSECPESFRFQAELRKHISEHFISSQNVQTANSSSQPATDGAVIKDPPAQSYFLPPRDGDCSNDFVLSVAVSQASQL